MSSKPNVLFLFSDQQRWDTMGCYGQKLPVTPNLDQMAAEGVRFEHAFTCQPVCGPARGCLQTGRYSVESGVYANHCGLDPNDKTVAEYMSDAGYEVGYIGKWHLGSWGERGGPDDFRTKPVPMDRRGGYKDFWLASDTLEFTSHSYDGHMFDQEGNKREFPEGRYRADVLTDWTIEYLENRNQDKPFFLFVSWIEPHHQNDNHCYEGPHGSKEQWKDYEVPGDLEGTEGDWRESYPDYLGCCNALDNGVGRIREALKKMGQDENTVIIYTSDHGSHFRTRNSEYKRSCHDNSLRVPLLVQGPGFTGGQVFGELTNLIDLPATVLAAGGVDKPDNMRGNPLQHLVDGKGEWPDYTFAQISESHVGRAVRTSKWKYAIETPGKNYHATEWYESFLYDLEADPHERNNLIADPAYQETRAEMAKLMEKAMLGAGEESPTIHPEDKRPEELLAPSTF